jgi:CII-binding regulator of phage lambda lysogenization HflD
MSDLIDALEATQSRLYGIDNSQADVAYDELSDIIKRVMALEQRLSNSNEIVKKLRIQVRNLGGIVNT